MKRLLLVNPVVWWALIAVALLALAFLIGWFL
jgi:hypothetical protein